MIFKKKKAKETSFAVSKDAFHFEEDLCLGCGLCQEICPVGAIELDDDLNPKWDYTLCVDCRACVSNCPTTAIEMD